MNFRSQGWHSNNDLDIVSRCVNEVTTYVGERVPRHNGPSTKMNTRQVPQTMMANGFENKQAKIYEYEDNG